MNTARFIFAIVALLGLSSCDNPLEPSTANCKAIFVNQANTTLKLIVDGQTVFDDNMFIDGEWLKTGLQDGTIHSYVATARDPRVFTKRGTFIVRSGVTETYEGEIYNAVISLR